MTDSAVGTTREGTGLFRTVVSVEVLSEAPLPEGVSLATLSYQTCEGGWSGVTTVESVEEVSRERMAELLIAQGSDPGFLMPDWDESDAG